MATVAETRTSTDAHLANREMREANALLVQERDTVVRETSQWQKVLAAVRAEVAASLGLPKLTKEHDNLLSLELFRQRDEATKDLDATLKRLEDVKKEEKTYSDGAPARQQELEQHTARVATLKAEAEKYGPLANQAKGNHAKLLNDLQTGLSQSELKIVNAEASLAATKAEEAKLLENRQAEDIRLSTKGRDLAIYEDRIRQAAAQLNPPMTIIL